MPRKNVKIGIQRCGLHPFEGWLVIQDMGDKVIAFPDNYSSCHYTKKETAEAIAEKKKKEWKNNGYVVKERPSGK
ncbi:hypothetical protein [Shimazuella alba]|uniref:Uncharacterized protein n=1 Tax=Shimazuella alba TaxID=2690964 RepID=A0A6I4VPB9_9BACL|nr:hypothetical protein [Shimazuella alba]MXQ52893.1 hypothetical protein [Shimazuella alba]